MTRGSLGIASRAASKQTRRSQAAFATVVHRPDVALWWTAAGLAQNKEVKLGLFLLTWKRFDPLVRTSRNLLQSAEWLVPQLGRKKPKTLNESAAVPRPWNSAIERQKLRPKIVWTPAGHDAVGASWLQKHDTAEAEPSECVGETWWNSPEVPNVTNGNMSKTSLPANSRLPSSVNT